MANRTLTRANNNPGEILEDGELHKVGMWEEVEIERSAAGQPGLLFVMTRYENDQMFDQMCVTVKDGDAFLAPVFDWLKRPVAMVRIPENRAIQPPEPERFARFGRYVAALLGSNLEWDGGDVLEDVAEKARGVLGVSVGDQNDEELAFWRNRADRLGIYYEPDEEEDEDDE